MTLGENPQNRETLTQMELQEVEDEVLEVEVGMIKLQILAWMMKMMVLNDGDEAFMPIFVFRVLGEEWVRGVLEMG